MHAIRGYEALELLHEGVKSSIYRGRRQQDGAAVVLKAFRGVATDPQEANRRRSEFSIAQRLQGASGVVRMEAFEELPEGTVLVMADTGGRALQGVLGQFALTLLEKLTLSRGLVRALGQVHASGVIHNDLSPGNV